MKYILTLIISILIVIDIIAQKEVKNENFELHYKKAIDNYRYSQYKEAIKEWQKAYDVTSSKYNKAKCLMNIAIGFKKIDLYDSAFVYNEKAGIILKDIDSLRLLGNLENNLGTLYLKTGAYHKAITHLLTALDIKKRTKNLKGAGSTLLNLGEVELRLDNLDKAQKYYLESLKIREQIKDTAGIASCYIDLGILEKRKANYDKAYKYYQNVLDLCQNNFRQSDRYKLIALENTGELKVVQGEPDMALPYFTEALSIANNINSLYDVSYCENEIAKIKLENNQLNAALKLAQNSYNTAKKINNLENLEQSTLLLSQIYERLGPSKKALNLLKEYQIYKDSLFDVSKVKQIQELESKYQTQQKEAQILKLSNENIKKEAALAKTRFIMYAVGGTSVFLLGLGFLFWQRRRQQQKLEVLASAVKAGEAEKQRIGKELHDGIAGSLIKLVYETEGDNLDLSDKLLKTYNEVRTLSHQLNNTPMHDEIFADRIEELLPENLPDKQFKIHIEPRNLKLPEPYGTHLYRIIQELIANNLKYANATETIINIVQKDDTLHFEYKDNGIGADDIRKGNGLKNITDRVTLMKSELQIHTEPGKGFSLNFTILHIPQTTQKKQHNESTNYKYSYN